MYLFICIIVLHKSVLTTSIIDILLFNVFGKKYLLFTLFDQNTQKNLVTVLLWNIIIPNNCFILQYI